MTKIDLITGFLGSGKTTFIKHYVNYLLNQGEKICILENDYGAINVDTMLLSELESDNCDIEMVAGGCDYDCHKRRFKTKLITMAMLGYSRVIIEPSGIFDVDEFFDIIHESPVSSMYDLENVITIVNSEISDSLSHESEYLLASQAAYAGCIVFSHIDCPNKKIIEKLCNRVNESLMNIKCKRVFDSGNTFFVSRVYLSDSDFEKISHSGYATNSFVKKFSMESNGFESLFFMNTAMNIDVLTEKISTLFSDSSIGRVVRVKGFIMSENDNNWIEINATEKEINTSITSKGQDVLIVIGENLNRKKIDTYFQSRYSSCRLD